MKKTYTISFLLLTLAVFAQVNNKAKTTSQNEAQFKQSNEKIEVYSGSSSNTNSKGGTETYTFSKGDKPETLKVTSSSTSSQNTSIPTFSSPNDVVAITEASGETYWMLVDGTTIEAQTVAPGTMYSVPAPKSDK